MTEKRFNLWDIEGTTFIEDHKEGSYHIGKTEDVDINSLRNITKRLNIYAEENEQLKSENKELRQDNDIKFWKLQCLQSLNNNQVMLFELSRVIQQGYEVSDKFKQYLDEVKEHDKEIREKHKRLFE